MGTPAEQPKVDNPMKTRLETLKGNVQDEVGKMEKHLKKASQDVGGKSEGKSWIGKTADNWHTEIEGNRGRMLRELKKLVPAIQRKLDSMPDKVPANEAKMMRIDMR
ncbi:hypothetical protein ACQYWQ_20135 [Streptomyces sp. P6-2-1]|uniref:hypothetical protein n=1 Tax=unclassified Streptomyces TaxID=2593676 RepID=UPI003D36B211